MKYNPHKIEQKWRERWEDERESYKLKPGKEKYYCLDMFSYPSSEGLHMGHWRPYTIADVWSRYQTLMGKQVLHPVGFDAFGLPAENAAIKTKTPPQEYTKKSITNFTRQLKDMGVMYDWSTLTITSSPEYYKWTQWIFLQLYKAGIAYRKSAPVNWCPSCQTVLANEQVIGGECERCGTQVTKKELKQWFLRITDFADDLLKYEGVTYPERVKTLQTNWIGKSEGSSIVFELANAKSSLEVFTTRPDTLFGVTYLVVAPEYKNIGDLITPDQAHEVTSYIKDALKQSEIDRLAEGKKKTGVFTGSYAIHPLTGEHIPVWVADYVIGTYGTGAVMAVPAHDNRDFEFAKEYNLPIIEVIEPVYTQTTEPGKVVEGLPFDHRDAIIAIVKHWKEDKYLGLKWKKVAWGTFITGGIEEGQTAEEAAKMEIREETGFLHPELKAELGMVHGKFYHVPKKLNRFAHAHALYFELKDGETESVSEAEQENHELVWLTADELVNFLTPDTHHHAFRNLTAKTAYTGYGILTNSGEFNGLTSEEAKEKIVAALDSKNQGKMAVQYRLRDWLVSRQRYWGAPIPIIYCQDCGEQPVAEEDLPVLLPDDAEFMPTGGSPLERHPSFKNATCPKCGGDAIRETDTLDTFVDSSWYYLRYTDPKNKEKAFDVEQVKTWLPVDFYIGGLEHATLHLLYARFITKALHKLNLIPFNEPFKHFYGNGMIYLYGKKMSKSKGNVVNPDEVVKKYGTDAMRGYILFMGPADQDVEWQANGIAGVSRFLDKAWVCFDKKLPESEDITPPVQKAYKEISTLLADYQFNRCISTLMKAINETEKQPLNKPSAEVLCTLFAPFFPHFAEEVWEKMGYSESIFNATWPEITVEEDNNVTYAIQVNGKTRATLTVPANEPEGVVTKKAKELEPVANNLSGKNIVKTVFVSGRIVNFVVE